MLNKRTMLQPNCILKWEKKYDIKFSDFQWKSIFQMPSLLFQSTKIREFQFKILHRAYASDSVVSNFDKSISKMCQLCDVKNDIIHMFVECRKVENFWNSLQLWYNSINNSPMTLDKRFIIFGVLTNPLDVAMNFCILYAKWYIHLQKIAKRDVSFKAYLKKLKAALTTEREIAVKKQKLTQFNKYLDHILDNL